MALAASSAVALAAEAMVLADSAVCSINGGVAVMVIMVGGGGVVG